MLIDFEPRSTTLVTSPVRRARWKRAATAGGGG